MQQFHFQLHISSDRYLDYYRGAATVVVARTTNGQTVQFPAALLQRHVTPDGIHGHFLLACDDHNKVIRLQRLAEATD